MSYCSTVLVGTVGTIDPIKDTQNSKYLRMSVVTDERYKDEVTPLWHRLTFWGRSAEIAAEHFRTGSGIMAECDLRYSEYTKKDGTEVREPDLVVQKFSFLTGSKPRGAGAKPAATAAAPAASAATAAASGETPGPSDDVPF